MIHKIKRSNNQNIYQLINDKLKGSNYTAEHCLTIRKNSGPARAARRINFESIVLSEGSQAQRSHSQDSTDAEYPEWANLQGP